MQGCNSLVELIEESVHHHASRTMTLCMNRRMSYGQLGNWSEALGAWLQGRRLAPGSRVAIMMPNLPQYAVALTGILRAGMVVVNVNPLYTARELEHQLVDSQAEAIIVLENFAHTLEEVIVRTAVRHVVLASLGDLLGPWKGWWINAAARHIRRAVPGFRLPLQGRTVCRFHEMLSEGQARTFRRVPVGPKDVAFLQYTGGTTGVSKAATLLHRNVLANTLQTHAWFLPVLTRLGSRQPTIVCALPLYHIFALTICYFLGLRLGALNLLIPNPRDIPGLIRTLVTHRVHLFPAVNTLFNALVNEPEFARLDFSELLACNGGGMAVQRATAEKWLAITGCPIAEGYGLSETSPVATSNRLDLKAFTGTIGLPIPSTDLAIRDEVGQDLPHGLAGEICIRGPQVMAGYWHQPLETAQVMTKDGFFRTGDIGVMDESGYITIVDRKKDMVIVSGFNVYPNEIEQVVHMLPGVLECAALGVPDPHSGEAIKLFVVKKEDSLSEDDILTHCRQQLTPYKRPKYIEFRDELPKSNVGKILKRELRIGR